MNRTDLLKLLADAPPAERCTVVLPDIGAVTLRRPDRAEVSRLMSAAQGDIDWEARALVGALRWALIDEDTSTTILASYAEAAAFLSAISNADAAVLIPALMDLLKEERTDG